MIYFYNKQLVEAELPEQGYKVGSDFSELNVHVALTPEQIAFYEANPTASAHEVNNCALNVVVVYEPTAVDLFDCNKAWKDVVEQLQDIYPNIAAHSFAINNGIMTKDFKWLNTLSGGLNLMGAIDEAHLNTFRQIFLNQNIDLTIYI